jgi:hypothetical protein
VLLVLLTCAFSRMGSRKRPTHNLV